MSYVCAYSSVQLDKSRVEKEFTEDCCQRQLRLVMVVYYSFTYVEMHIFMNFCHGEYFTDNFVENFVKF